MIRELAPAAKVVVGMSLGGLTALALATEAPEVVRNLVLVDVTPGVDRDKASDVIAFLAGPPKFDSFDEILERTVLFNPTRSESSLRRGILHNAAEQPDGTWAWRYERMQLPEGATMPDFGALWDYVDAVHVPLLLVRGADSPVVGDEDVAELRATATRCDGGRGRGGRAQHPGRSATRARIADRGASRRLAVLTCSLVSRALARALCPVREVLWRSSARSVGE